MDDPLVNTTLSAVVVAAEMLVGHAMAAPAMVLAV